MSTPRKRLLIVDDEPLITDVLSEHFKTSYTVETALNGADALAAVRRTRPDIVFLDITMPRMSGIEVLKEIKTIDPTIVVIMVTANEHVALAAEAIKNGAVAYVPKPFDLRYLDHVVADLVAKSGAPRTPR